MDRSTAALKGEILTGVESDDIGDLQRRHRVVGSEFVATAVGALREGRADEMIIDTSREPPHTFTVAGVVGHVITFAAYRRTIVLGFLSSAGVHDLGFGDPSGYLAEH